MKKLLVICGPTATGKTSLAIKLAEKFNGEIVSADSRQVYKGMDIGTGKDLPKILNFKSLKDDYQSSTINHQSLMLTVGYYLVDTIPIWLVDLVSPRYRFSVADWLKCAQIVIAGIWQRGKLPIVVGGTGFYIKALIDGIGSLGVPADEKLRKKLEKLSVAQLQERVEKLAPEVFRRMNNSDRNNPRRLIRKIEILTCRHAEFISASSFNKKRSRNSASRRIGMTNKSSFQIGLTADRREIYKRIDQRVKERLENGLLEEIKSLLKNGVKWSDPGMNCLAYKEFKPYFKGEKALEECVERWRFDEHKYARKQLTWFKKDKRIKWFDITDRNFAKEVVETAGRWYIEVNPLTINH